MSGVINANVEKQILTGLIIDETFCEKVIPILKSNLNYIRVPFARNVAGWCVDYWNRYEKPIGRHIQDEYFDKKKHSLPEDDAELISEFLDRLSKQYKKKNGNFNPDYAIDRTLNYFRLTDIDNLQKQLSRNLKSGKVDIDKVEKSIADYKALDFTSNVENTRQSLKDFKTVYLVSREKHISRLEWIVGDAEKVVMIPEKLPKDFEQCFSDKEVVIVTSGTENKNIETLKGVLPNTSTGLRIVDIPFLDKEGVLFNKHMKNGDEFVQSMYQDMFEWDLYKTSDLVETKLENALKKNGNAV